MSDAPEATFAPIARRVARRVALRRWLAGLGRGLGAAAGGSAVLALAALMTGLSSLAFLAWAVLAVWLAAPLVGLLWRRPGGYSVLALWDEAAGRREAFASAWWFEQQPTLTEAQKAHVEAQRTLLPEAARGLARDLPLRPHGWLWLPPVLALAGLFLTSVVHPEPERLTLDEAMEAAARLEAQKLAQTAWEKKQLEGLDAEEQAALEQLKQGLKQTAENLEQSGGKDAREVMSDLERRAREAEKLAERLGADKDTWASDKLIQSLREHADTADLGDAVAAKNAGQTAQAAEALAEQLKSPQLTQDARERLNETLKDHEKSAEKEDLTRAVGQHVVGAARQMQQARPAEAGGEFERLAEKMRDQARRDQAQQELQKLAQQLRDAGSSISGQNQAGSMQQMAAAGQQGAQAPQSPGQAPQVGQAQAPQAGQQGQPQLQPPGLGQMGQPQSQMMQQNPVPGTGQPQRMMMPQPGQQGQSPKDGQPMLLAPIPGQKPGQKPDALLLGPPGANSEPGQGIAMAMPGGRDPGVGKADLNAAPTGAQKSAQQSVVAAQQNNEGQSSVRSVEGGARQEGASRTASQIAAEALAAEEAALDEAVLPPSRREQVRRYFTELRKRFEKP